METQTQKTILWVLGGCLLGAFVMALVATQTPLFSGSNSSPEDGEVTAGMEEEEENGGTTLAGGTNGDVMGEETVTSAHSRVLVSDQPSGGTVLVSSATLDQDGWVVVHEVVAGNVANALGAARRDAGNHQDIFVKLLRGTDAGKSYVVVLYADNGDKVFELKADLPLVDAEGEPVMRQFRAQGEASTETGV